MQLIANGPDIPTAALHAQEEGKLVFFCGAGISMPSGLPDFRRLVEDVRDHLGADFTAQEEREFKAEAYDRVLGLLELETRFGIKVRQRVIQRLAVGASPSLDMHSSLITLGRRPNGTLQLVTTNFDNLFQLADPNCLTSDAPQLPIPKPDKWDGLVHLHGRIVPHDPNGRRLILTAADFGVAYLVERWAARFVSELFQQFDVAFVGYRVDDPVMRYLVDAVAVERRQDRRLHNAYAFAQCASDKRDEVAQEWRARGIEPILYDPKDDHAALRETLTTWARKFNGGLLSRTALVNELALKEPQALPREELEQFCWAVSDPSGAPARCLAELGQTARFGWVRVLEDFKVLPRDPRIGSDRVGLVNRSVSVFPIDVMTFFVAAWVAQHAGSVECLQWARERGGVLHPRFRSEVLRLVDQGKVPAPFNDAWRLIADFQGTSDDLEYFRLSKRLEDEQWRPGVKLALLDAFQPILNFGERHLFPSVVAEDDVQRQVAQLVRVECEIAAGSAAEDVILALQGRTDFSTIAAELLPTVNSLLLRALDLLAATGQASQTEDESYIHQPSIAPHTQNRHHQGWTWLIEFVRICLEASGTGSQASMATISTWLPGQFPLLRRLTLHSARTIGDPTADKIVDLLKSDPANWLWNTRLQVELFPLLRELHSKVSADQQQALLDVLASGPPEEMFREGLEDAVRKDRRDRLIWERLARVLVGAPFDSRPSVLDEIEDRHPDWKLSENDRDAFLFWVEVGWGLKSDVTAESLASLPIEQLVEVLERRKADEGVIDRWGSVVKKEPTTALQVLGALVAHGNFAHELWAATIYDLRQATTTDQQKGQLLDLTEKIPQGVLETMLWPMSELLQGWSSVSTIQQQIVAKTGSLFDAAAKLPFDNDKDLLSAAVNAPTGKLAGAVLEIVRVRELGRNTGLPADLRVLLTDVVESKEQSAILGRVMLASRLAVLHDIDPEWTEQVLLPCFGWERPLEARAAWQGFLWSPWVRPSLWQQLKPYALQTVDHLADLGKGHEQLVPFLVSVSVDGDGALSLKETRQLLKQLSPADLALAAQWLEARVGATASSETGWKTIADWIAASWPKELSAQTPTVSRHLAEIPVSAPKRFPEAVTLVAELIGPIEDGYSILTELATHNLHTKHPHSALTLVNLITPDAPTPWFGDLRGTLQHIEAASPALKDDSRFVRLLKISTKTGI